jgi:hypothetical protein
MLKRLCDQRLQDTFGGHIQPGIALLGMITALLF